MKVLWFYGLDEIRNNCLNAQMLMVNNHECNTKLSSFMKRVFDHVAIMFIVFVFYI